VHLVKWDRGPHVEDVTRTSSQTSLRNVFFWRIEVRCMEQGVEP
jgi:hypothetical protein